MNGTADLQPREDLLARAFIDELGRKLGSGKPSLLTAKRDDAVEQLIGDLSDEDASAVSVRPDFAAVAILVARAIDKVPGLMRDLRRASPIVSVSTGQSSLVAPAAHVINTCAFGPDTHVVTDGLSTRHLDVQERTALLLQRDGSNSKVHAPDVGNGDVATALQYGVPVVGIASDAKRHLPRDLLRASQANLVLDRLDVDVIALVIEAVTGYRPSVSLDPKVMRFCDTSDLCLAIRRGRSADDCVAALLDVINSKRSLDLDGPRLEDLAGYGEAGVWGRSVVFDLEALRAGRLKWSDCDCRSVLLSGPPGVGKTQFASALARSAQVPLVRSSVSEWNAVTYLSGTLQSMSNAFAEATRLAPAILLIDELDGISDRARIGGEYAEYWIQIVNRLNECLSAIRDVDGIVVVTCTNFPEKIDAATRRAGRLDKTIEIGKPGFEDILAIFRYYLRGDLSGASLNEAASAAAGASGADVERWVVSARSSARRQEKPLSLDLLVQTIRDGRTSMPAPLRRTVAIHEAGHVVVGAALGNWTTHNVTIGDGGGLVTGNADISGATKAILLDHIVSVLAGRAAEETFGVATTGAGGRGGDLSRATVLACHIETTFGFGSMGLVCVADDRGGHPLERFPSLIRPVSRNLAQCMTRAKAIVIRNREAILALADELDAKTHLDAAAVADLLKRFPPQLPSPSPTPMTGEADDASVAIDGA